MIFISTSCEEVDDIRTCYRDNCMVSNGVVIKVVKDHNIFISSVGFNRETFCLVYYNGTGDWYFFHSRSKEIQDWFVLMTTVSKGIILDLESFAILLVDCQGLSLLIYQ